MSDTAMLFAAPPVLFVHLLIMLQLHAEWLLTGEQAERERKELERVLIEERSRKRQELLEWADSLPTEPEPTRTYERAKGVPAPETGTTTEWEEVTYN